MSHCMLYNDKNNDSILIFCVCNDNVQMWIEINIALLHLKLIKLLKTLVAASLYEFCTKQLFLKSHP